MNISSEIFHTDFTDYNSYNRTEREIGFAVIAVNIVNILLGFPINSYVIWLIVTGTGNGLAAEFFSLNLAVCEIFICVESVLNFLIYKFKVWWELFSFLDGLIITGRPLFQCLICVERYLAVVYPVTFLKFKPLRYRVICSIIVWGASFVSGGFNIILTLFFFRTDLYIVSVLGQFSLFFCIQLFCLVAVLRALKQSGPGERGRERNEENHMKRKAFHLILITTVTMLIMYFPFLISIILSMLGGNIETFSNIAYICFFLAGLVQPLLFFYRIGKKMFCSFVRETCNLAQSELISV